MSLRSPLGRVLGLGSAKEGTEHWWGQRISAAALVLLGLWFAVAMAHLHVSHYEDVIAFIAMPVHSVLLILLCATMAYHSWLGIQVVIEDYVHGPVAKIALLTLSRFVHVFVAVASIYAILRIGITA
jgi:succinate dehydrogenase / fumarate reductase membrane anchor subunit